MKTTNLRNKPIDRRRLSAEDRSQYKPQARSNALAKARQRRGNMAWANKTKQGRQEQRPGTGGFTADITTQQARMRQEGAKVKRAKALRPEDPS